MKRIFTFILLVALTGVGQMARSKPDWGISVYQTAGDVSDMGEVAARQSGISPIDSLGRTLIFDDFSDGRTRGKLVLQNGATVFPTIKQQITEYTSTTVIVGAGLVSGYGLSFPVLVTPTQQVNLVYDIMLGQTSVVGLECGLWIDSALSPDWNMAMIYDRGGTERTAQLDYNAATQTLSANGTTVKTFAGVVGWAQIKLVANFETGRYVRAIVGENRTDLSAVNMVSSAVLPTDELNAGVSIIARAAATRPVVVAYCMITRDEP